MSIQDKVSGRLKKAAGDLTGDEQLRDQGAREERKAELRRELRETEQHAASLRDEIARLEYTSHPERPSQPAVGDEPAPNAPVQDAQTRARRSAEDAMDTTRSERR